MPLPGPRREQRRPRLDEALDVALLDLQVRQVPQDLAVAAVLQGERLELERALVALDGLGVVAVCAVEEAVDVPADVRRDAERQGLFREGVGLVAAAGRRGGALGSRSRGVGHAGDAEGLHGDGVGVVGEFSVFFRSGFFFLLNSNFT